MDAKGIAIREPGPAGAAAIPAKPFFAGSSSPVDAADTDGADDAPAPPPAKPERQRSRALYITLLLLLLGAAFGFGLGLGHRIFFSAAAAAAQATASVTLSTPASSLTPALAAAIRCDVAKTLAPLGVSLAQVALVASTSVTGAVAPLGAASAANAIGACAARALHGRGLQACVQPLSQALSSVTLSIGGIGLGAADAVFAALASAAFTSAWREGAR